MHVAIVDVLGSPYDGSTLSKRGLGGSESAVISIARELVKLGIAVTVFNDCTNMDAKPGRYDGVRYFDRDDVSWVPGFYDVVISSRSVRPFVDVKIHGEKKILWMHDTFCDGDQLVEQMVVNGEIDEIWTLSDWHTQYISNCTHGHRRMAEVLKRKIWVTRNGINLYSNEVDMDSKNRDVFVFNAAVNKGMKTLLNDIWPRVYEGTNGVAELIVVGGAYPLKDEDVQNDELKKLEDQHDGKNGVRFTGIISQKEVAHILETSGFMIYPQELPETFGISTVESLAYGTPVITGRFGAMEETAIDDACYLMDYPVKSNVLYEFNEPAHINHFVEMAIKAWEDGYLWTQKCNAGLKVREVATWDKVALQWKQHLFKITGNYLPVEETRKVQRINHRTHQIFNKRWSNPEEWAYYPEKEKPIHVIVPFYNASQYLKKCVDSIRSQDYQNYKVHLVDDGSTDGSFDMLDEMLAKEFKFNFYRNDRAGALANQLMICQDGDIEMDAIFVLVDGDDALINDPYVFKKINQIYSDGIVEMTYGSMWSMADNIPLIAQEYPLEVQREKSYRTHKFAWNIPYTHLRTFKWSLFDRIDDSALRDDSGDYFKAGGDAALFYALAEAAQPGGLRAVRDILYLYNDLNPINDYKVNSEEQTKNAAQVLAKPVPKKDLSGLIRALKMHYEVTKPKKILIAIPTAKDIHPETFRSIYNLEVPEGFETEFQFFFGYRVDQVRNLIADWVVKDYDYLFAVDHDMGFPPNTLKRMLSYDKDIISGMYIQRRPGNFIELYKHGRRVTLLDFKDEALIEVDSCGFGCVLVKKQVFVDIEYPQFEYHHALTMEDTISEDTDFCIKAQKAGYKIYADGGIQCDHYGETNYRMF